MRGGSETPSRPSVACVGVRQASVDVIIHMSVLDSLKGCLVKIARVNVMLLAAATVLALSACASNESAKPAATTGGALTAPNVSASGKLAAGGSTAQQAAETAWISAFQTSNPGATVNYEGTGSGAGRTSFIGGSYAFAGSDAYLSTTELGKASPTCAAGTSAIDIPVYISPIAIVYNLSGVSSLQLDASTAAKIFKGTITQWNDPAIAALNPGVTLPSAQITAVHRSDDSGTTRNFTDYFKQNAPDVWDATPADAFPYKTGDGSKGTSGVVTSVSSNQNTIGYVDESQAGKLQIAKIKVGSSYVAPSATGAAAVVDASPIVSGRATNDLAVQIDRTGTNPSTYPLLLVSYAIACQQYADANTGTLVKQYLTWITSTAGQNLAHSNAGSAPLSAGMASKVATAIGSIK